ncbi:hypothetical protein GGF32_006752 [Allomyces javanicus]|nr:hypothetical protein GGF32_006752 [Allomyces javanicus]
MISAFASPRKASQRLHERRFDWVLASLQRPLRDAVHAVVGSPSHPAPPAAQLDFDDDLPDEPLAPIRAASPPLLSSSDLRPGKYLSYLPHGGYQAQRQALEHAFVLAKALGRNLLVPPLLVGPGSLKNAPMLDLQRALLDVPIDRLRSWRGEFSWGEDEDVLFTTTFAESARWWAAAGKVSWWGQGEPDVGTLVGPVTAEQQEVDDDDVDLVRAGALAVMRAVASASTSTGSVPELDAAAMAERGVRMPLDPAEPERKPHVHLVPGDAPITDHDEVQGSRSIRIDELVEQTVDADLVVIGSLASRDRVVLTRPAWVEVRDKVAETTARPKLSPDAQSAAMAVVKLLGEPGRFVAAHFWSHEDNDDAVTHRVAAAIKAQLALNPSLKQHSSPLCPTTTGPPIFLIANSPAQVRAITQHFPCTITLATFLSLDDETGIGRHLRAAPTAWAAVDSVVASAAAAYVGAEGNAFSDQVVRQWVLRACGTVKGGVGKKCAARAVRV